MSSPAAPTRRSHGRHCGGGAGRRGWTMINRCDDWTMDPGVCARETVNGMFLGLSVLGAGGWLAPDYQPMIDEALLRCDCHKPGVRA